MGHEYYREEPEEIYLNPIYGGHRYEEDDWAGNGLPPAPDEEMYVTDRDSGFYGGASEQVYDPDYEADDDIVFVDTEQEPERRPGKKKKKRKRKKRSKKARKIRRRLFLILILLIAAAVLYAVFGCVNEGMEISGNTVYSDEEITGYLQDVRWSDHTIPVWFYCNWYYRGGIPFIGDFDAEFEDSRHLNIHVSEKLPTAYVQYADSRLYLDRQGNVMVNSPREIAGIPELTGMDVDKAQIGEPLPVGDITLLEAVCTAAKDLDMLGLSATSLSVDEKGDVTIVCGQIELRMGQSRDMDKKVSLAVILMEKLEGKSGILHLEDYDGSNGSRSFEEK